MADFWFYSQLGFSHVLDWNGYDHVLFLAALAAPFTIVNWRKLLILVSVFTLGHTVSLLFTHYTSISYDSALIECFIPITIAMTAMYNFRKIKPQQEEKTLLFLTLITFVFGCIHGFGFATYYKMIVQENHITALLSFAIGVEFAQILIVLGMLLLTTIFVQVLKISATLWLTVVSILILIWSLPMLYDSCFTPFVLN